MYPLNSFLLESNFSQFHNNPIEHWFCWDWVRLLFTYLLALETSNGFQCPPRPEVQEGAQFDPHPRFADANDCAKFYICLNGISPREQGCDAGLVFNELNMQCDAPENVPECADYYAFLDEDNKKRRK